MTTGGGQMFPMRRPGKMGNALSGFAASRTATGVAFLVATLFLIAVPGARSAYAYDAADAAVDAFVEGGAAVGAAVGVTVGPTEKELVKSLVRCTVNAADGAQGKKLLE